MNKHYMFYLNWIFFKGVLRTRSNIYDGTFCKNNLRLNATILAKTPHLRFYVSVLHIKITSPKPFILKAKNIFKMRCIYFICKLKNGRNIHTSFGTLWYLRIPPSSPDENSSYFKFTKYLCTL